MSHNPYRIDGNLDVVSYIKEYLHLKKVSEGEDIENTQDDASLEENAQDADEMQTDQKKEPPLHVKAVKEVRILLIRYC